MENFKDDFVSSNGEDTFLKIKTATRGLIKGESQDARHPDEICVHDWSWGMEARSGLSGAGGSSQATLKPLHIVIRADRATTALMSTLRNHDLIKEVVLSVCKAGRNQPAYFKLILANARITFLKVKTLTWDGQPALVVYLSFSFQDFRAEYTPRIQEGAQGSTLIGDPGPVLVAGLVGSLKGILQGAKKAGSSDKKPEAPDKPPAVAQAPVPRPRTHADVLGKSEGGPGVWGETAKRSKGEAYQEQISGVERGVEYKVKDVNFDGYDPKRKVLVDAKDWEGWPPTTGNKKLLEQFEKKTLEQARRQRDAVLGTGSKIEWHVSTKEKAKAVSKFLEKNTMRDIAVVHTPKL